MLFDCHTHTKISHDSTQEPVQSVLNAEQKGLSGIAFTDHCDMEFFDKMDVITPIIESVRATTEWREKFAGRIKVFCGVEIGEAHWNPQIANELLKKCRFDIVLGSVHAVRYAEYTMPYSVIDFSVFSNDEIRRYLTCYFRDMEEMLETTDFDVLAHLTCPLRYITEKYGKAVETGYFSNQIEHILKILIQKDIALEVNISGWTEKAEVFMPDLMIVRRYRELGGQKITIGSDAHIADRIANGFDLLAKQLKAMNIHSLYYYENRQPIPYEI